MSAQIGSISAASSCVGRRAPMIGVSTSTWNGRTNSNSPTARKRDDEHPVRHLGRRNEMDRQPEHHQREQAERQHHDHGDERPECAPLYSACSPVPIHPGHRIRPTLKTSSGFVVGTGEPPETWRHDGRRKRGFATSDGETLATGNVDDMTIEGLHVDVRQVREMLDDSARLVRHRSRGGRSGSCSKRGWSPAPASTGRSRRRRSTSSPCSPTTARRARTHSPWRRRPSRSPAPTSCRRTSSASRWRGRCTCWRSSTIRRATSPPRSTTGCARCRCTARPTTPATRRASCTPSPRCTSRWATTIGRSPPTSRRSR